MAEGVRLRQIDERAWGATVIVPHPRKPYHIRVNPSGYAFVAPLIWQRLQEASAIVDHGFELVNTVAQPPGMWIHMGVKSTERTFQLAERAMREIVPNGVQVTIGSKHG